MRPWLILFGIWVTGLCLIAAAGLYWGRRQVEKHDPPPPDELRRRPP